MHPHKRLTILILTAAFDARRLLVMRDRGFLPVIPFPKGVL